MNVHTAHAAGVAAAAAKPEAVPTPVWVGRPAPDWSRHFRGRAGCFAVLDVRSGQTVHSDPERCAERFRPFSTFKIPNTLIGLETGVVTGPDDVINWDRGKYRRESWWPKSWSERNDLRTAFHESVVPFYRELASRVGEDAMRRWVTAFDYGNRDISGGVDQFWLTGKLAISADEQLAFLRALHEGALPLSARTLAAFRDIFVKDGIAGKTGTGKLDDGTALGWYVGWVDRGQAGSPGAPDAAPDAAPGAASNAYVFALNISGADYDAIPRAERIAMSRAMLAELGVLPNP